MFRNYLITALRSMVRHKLYSFINIAGLALGLACVIFIALFIRDELSFDKWVPGSENLYRVDTGGQLPGRPIDWFAMAPFPLPAFMKDNLPEVTAMTRLWPVRMPVQIGDRQFNDEIAEADPNFFTVMNLPLVAGDPGQVLMRPESIVLSQALARKYFGAGNPIGRQVVMNRSNCGRELISCPEAAVVVRVTGVMRDLPHNTQFKINAVIPFNSPADRIGEQNKKAWFNFNGVGYVRLAAGADPAQVAEKLRGLMDRLVDLSADLGMRVKAGKVMQVELVSFRNAHMNTKDALKGGLETPGNWTTIYGLGVIGAVILLAACFNFTNLATARAMMRAREIGLRKCVGASRRQVALQFLGEAVLMALVALIFALAVVEILLPAFGSFLQRPISLSYFQDWLLLVILGIAVMAGLLSGVYPALILSGFRPVIALRSNQSGQAGRGYMRPILVVLQFAVSIGLGIATLVIFTQIEHAHNVALGFKRDNIVVINTARRMETPARESFMNILRAYPGISGVGASGDTPFSSSLQITGVSAPGQAGTEQVELLLITPRFLDLYGMKLATGRTLSEQRAEDAVINRPDTVNDGHNVLINEAAARFFNFGVQGAIGKTLRRDSDTLRIAGVLKDVRFKGARQPIRPVIYFNDKIDSTVVSVRLTGHDVPAALDFIDGTWRRMSPSIGISRRFLDDSFEQLYQADRKQGAIFGVFVGVAILISALGLFGLAAFTVGCRTREIGIRKVFGARTRDLVALLLWQFSIPLVAANLIAWPLAWYYLNGWLQGFSYRISLGPIYFVAVGVAALLIAWLTVIGHALRVARANPINALRYE